MTTNTSSSAARQKSALAFINSFTTFSKTDCLSVRTPNCMHHFAPHSIAPPLPLSNDAFIAHLETLRTVISSFPLQVKEMIDNPTANQVLIWCTASPVWVPRVMDIVGEGKGDGDKEVDWVYTGEYMFLLSFEEGETGGDDGEGGALKRIERIVEFLDSYGTVRVRGLMKMAKERLEGRGGEGLREMKVDD